MFMSFSIEKSYKDLSIKKIKLCTVDYTKCFNLILRQRSKIWLSYRNYNKDSEMNYFVLKLYMLAYYIILTHKG